MIHKEHRKRMYEKLSNSEALHDHELLEILLFGAIPRVNTNLTAHNLLAKFGTISGVFNATYDQLVSVEGIGKKTAWHIICIGECMRRASYGYTGFAVLKNVKDFKNFVIARMRNRGSEVLEFYFLNKTGKVFSVKTFSNDNQNMVQVGMEEIAHALATEKPYGLLVAHNHLSGNSLPSDNDKQFTMEVTTMCSISNVNLYDHCIYASDNDIYSYRLSGELEDLKKECNLKNLLNEHFANVLKKK